MFLPQNIRIAAEAPLSARVAQDSDALLPLARNRGLVRAQPRAYGKTFGVTKDSRNLFRLPPRR